MNTQPKFIRGCDLTHLELTRGIDDGDLVFFRQDAENEDWYVVRPRTIHAVPAEVRPAIVKSTPSDSIIFGSESAVKFTGLEGEADD